MFGNEIWNEVLVSVAFGDQTRSVEGWSFGDFIAYRRSERHSEPVFLAHRATGVEFCAFENADVAAVAGEIADGMIDPDFSRLDQQRRHEEGMAIVAAWQRAGLYPSSAADELGHPVWRVRNLDAAANAVPKLYGRSRN